MYRILNLGNKMFSSEDDIIKKIFFYMEYVHGEMSKDGYVSEAVRGNTKDANVQKNVRIPKCTLAYCNLQLHLNDNTSIICYAQRYRGKLSNRSPFAKSIFSPYLKKTIDFFKEE